MSAQVAIKTELIKVTFQYKNLRMASLESMSSSMNGGSNIEMSIKGARMT